MNKKGFTLIELLIVIAIIGIVAAIAIPNLLTALQKGKQKATMGDMKSMGTAIESYVTDNYFAPQTDISGLRAVLVPFHTRVLITQDAWGFNYNYAAGAMGSAQDYYTVISYGRGGAAMGAYDLNNSKYTVSAMIHFENDIVFSNGNFVYGPK
jgi:type II secretion system protein G